VLDAPRAGGLRGGHRPPARAWPQDILSRRLAATRPAPPSGVADRRFLRSAAARALAQVRTHIPTRGFRDARAGGGDRPGRARAVVLVALARHLSCRPSTATVRTPGRQ